MTDENRGALPTNERVAILEAETRNTKEVIREIRDAIVGINSTLRDVVRLEQRQTEIHENMNRMHRAVEQERNARIKGDQNEASERISGDHKLGERVNVLESEGGKNNYVRGWLERLAVPFVSAALAAATAVYLVK